jgi:hypothetical protein
MFTSDELARHRLAYALTTNCALGIKKPRLRLPEGSKVALSSSYSLLTHSCMGPTADVVRNKQVNVIGGAIQYI